MNQEETHEAYIKRYAELIDLQVRQDNEDREYASLWKYITSSCTARVYRRPQDVRRMFDGLKDKMRETHE